MGVGVPVVENICLVYVATAQDGRLMCVGVTGWRARVVSRPDVGATPPRARRTRPPRCMIRDAFVAESREQGRGGGGRRGEELMRSGWGRERGGQSLSHRGVKWRNAVVFFCLVGHHLPLLCCSRLLGWWWWLWRVDRRPLYGRNVWRDGCRPAWLRGGRAVGRGEDEGRGEVPWWRRVKFVLTTTTARGGDRRRQTPASGLAAANAGVRGARVATCNPPPPTDPGGARRSPAAPGGAPASASCAPCTWP